jgi:hypothetical protein
MVTAPNYGAVTQTDNANNYLGPFFVIGANQTPFLSMMGGMRGYKSAPGFSYPMDQYTLLEAATQAVYSEDDAIAGAQTPTTYGKAQGINTAQIMMRNITVSYAKAAERLKIAGVTYSTAQEYMQAELDFQTEMAMRQMAIDFEKSCLQGVYLTRTDSTTATATGGICTGLETAGTGAGFTAVDAGTGDALTKAMVDSVSKKMADAGAPMTNMVIFAGSFQMQQLSDLYGWSPVGGTGEGLGGIRVNKLMTQFFEAEVVFAPQMRTDDILFCDIDKCQIRGVEVPGLGAMFIEPKGKTGAAFQYQLISHLGMDYGDTRFHGLIYDLSTS